MINNKKHRHVFLISIDALRADHIGFISKSGLTPNLDALSNQSIVYKNAFANGPGTNQSFPSILSSTNFLSNNGFTLSLKSKTIAEVLQENCYITAAFHSNPFLSSTFGWNRGFDYFKDYNEKFHSPSAFVTSKQKKTLKNITLRKMLSILRLETNPNLRQILRRIFHRFQNFEIPYLEGNLLNKEIYNWIEKNNVNSTDKNIFIWMHYMDTHSPYIPPKEYLTEFNSREEAFNFNNSISANPRRDENRLLQDLYRGEVRYVDNCIGNLIKYLSKNEMLEDSLIFVVSDHGESFLEHSFLGHKPNNLYNEVLHVPILIYGLNKQKTISTPVQLMDIAPTLLDILNLDSPPSFLGRVLPGISTNKYEEQPIFSESSKPDLVNLKYDNSKKAISCIFSGWKLIHNEMDQKTELYNLKNDFNEKNNLIKTERGEYKKLMKFIEDKYVNNS